MDSNGPPSLPPTQWVLKPHHLVLLAFLMATWKDLDIKKLPSPFAIHLQRTLLHEISEVTIPRTHRQLLNEIASGPQADVKESQQLIATLRTVHTEVYSIEKLGNFLASIPALFIDKVADDSPRFMRRSLFGYFVRRCFFSYIKLSYQGLSKLQTDFEDWCAGKSAKLREPPPADFTLENHIHNTGSHKKTWAQPDKYSAFEMGKAVGDENEAIESIRSFFEQHFHDQIDSGFRQHALLNVVHWHYINKEYVAARKLLGEAITASRTANDRATLLHCLSLLNRLPSGSGDKASINEIQPDLDPLEVLFDVKKLIDEENEQPLSAAFEKIVQAMGLYDHRLDSGKIDFGKPPPSSIPDENYQWARHTVESVVWQEAGCIKLADISERIVIAFTDVGSEDSNRLTVLVNRAYRTARQGKYNEALSILLEPTTWRGITLTDYNLWAYELWSILALRAVRRGQHRHYTEYLLPRRPQGDFSPRYHQFEHALAASLPAVRQCIFQVLELKQNDQISSSIRDLLKLLWQSEFLGRYHAYRTGIILMADFGLEYGMAKKSKRILGDIMPQLISGDDLEQRAVACMTFARCLLAAEDGQTHTQQTCLDVCRYLDIACQDFMALQMYRSLKEALFIQIAVCETIGRVADRNRLLGAFKQADEEDKKMAEWVVDEEVQRIHATLVLVGSGLASR
ncbi:hypothetical protein BKA70DRAFT_1247713 [Coprinopsis sp. MPI-PUGE-AT-0042]|nr:hypothetical protein BKA70DRAFT_1247713 [Coprinopsis sp. MPI-PUGE-AT-0042]